MPLELMNVVKTGTMTVKGFNFTPGKIATMTFIQGTTTNKTVATPTAVRLSRNERACSIP